MSASAAPKSPQPASTRHFFGIREPGRLAVAMFRLPLHLYHRGWGPLLGHTFLVFVHVGRRTGSPHETTAMMLGSTARRTKPSSVPHGDRTLTGYGTSAFARHYGSRSAASPSSLSTDSSPRARPSPPASSSAVGTHGDSASWRGCSVGATCDPMQPFESSSVPGPSSRSAPTRRPDRIGPPHRPHGRRTTRPSSLTGLEAARLGGHQLPELREP